jgi:Cu2+-exporting ATPase
MNGAASPWSRPALADQVLRRRRDGLAELALRIPALAVPRSALRLEQALHALPGVSRISTDVAAQRVRLTIDDRVAPLPRVLATCVAAGCEARPLHRDSLDDTGRSLLDASLKRLLVAGVFAMQAMMFALVLYLGAIGSLDATTAQLFRWLGMLAALPVVGYAAWPFYRDALAGLRTALPGIDVPVALAIVLIFVASTANALRGGGEVYFDSISMFVFVLLLGRHLELRARVKHRALGEVAADAIPLVAQRRCGDGTLETVAAAELVPGDRVHVAEGDAAPCDGVLESNAARTDESLLSGESRACVHLRGDSIAAGSIALGAPLELRVLRDSASSATGVLAKLAGAARHSEHATEGGEAPAARAFVWRVLALALTTASFWLWRDPARVFEATVAVLVVACPCAFGLAAPAVLTRSMAVLARAGVLVVRPAALAALASADRVLFDKTGTLTEPAVVEDGIEAFRGMSRAEALGLAAALAQASRHPAALAITRVAGAAQVAAAADGEAIPGGGLRGRVLDRELRLGHAGFTGAAQHEDDALWLADQAGPLARFPIEESLRPRALETIDALRGAGVMPAIVSGDAAVRVENIAARLGIEDWAARQSPEAKFRRVRAEQAAGAVVLAVGDGSNDAAALAAADVSAVPPGGTDLARAHAGLVLLHGLPDVPRARELALRARAIMAANRRWSLVWNLGAIPFAALGFVPPWLAAIGMSVSSLAVVLNTLRIRERTGARPPAARLRERAA